jgi:hypothetical protein
MKILVFLPMILFMAVFGLLILGFFGLVIKLVLRAKNSAWTGQVIDKLFNQRRDSDSNRMENFFTLVVTPDGGGRDMKLGVSKQLYDTFEVGDKIKKDKGELLPKKI